MSKCRKCGNEEYLRKGLCYKCYKKYIEDKQKDNIDLLAKYKKSSPKKDIIGQNFGKNENSQSINIPKSDAIINILVVDDEPTVLESFKMMFSDILKESRPLLIKKLDIVIETAEDNKDAIEKLKSNSYDIVFTDNNHIKNIDLGFSDLTPGIELLRYIKENYPTTEVVIDTAYATPEAHVRSIQLGALEYLRKPFLMEEIYELVDRAITKRKKKSEMS